MRFLEPLFARARRVKESEVRTGKAVEEANRVTDRAEEYRLGERARMARLADEYRKAAEALRKR